MMLASLKGPRDDANDDGLAKRLLKARTNAHIPGLAGAAAERAAG